MIDNKIYLCDLTHDGMVLSSSIFPLSIGLISAYLKEKIGKHIDIELFKYPNELSDALIKAPPKIVGFANYSWNFALSRAYAEQIKLLWPDTIIIFGGPNYGLTEEETDFFWKRNSNIIDFNVVREGEEAFLNLYKLLAENGMNAKALKEKQISIGNVHYFLNEKLIKGEDLPRINLSDLPSPYLMGLFDKFFDGKLTPLIHTTRGCPFSCSFCTEGAAYYNKVDQRTGELEAEMEYIASRVYGTAINDLFISDANFGMFKQDFEKAKIISDTQDKYSYPRHIHVSTGKNQKARVIEIVKSLNGAVSMAASLQSTDKEVLKNVARSNISIEQLSEAGQTASNNQTGTYSELILGLPGDSVDAHRKSLKDVVDMRFDNIRMYQLIMLPQTPINTPLERRKYNMKTMFRIMPRSFGNYKIGNKKFVAVEYEEILISNSTLPFKDYAYCREMDLTVEILHNGKVYTEVIGICDAYGLSWFGLIIKFFEKRYDLTPDISKMYKEFCKGTTKQLWPNEDELTDYVKDNIDSLLVDERGTNEMSTGKATAFFKLLEQVNKALFQLLREELKQEGKLNTLANKHINEIEKYSLLRKTNLLQENEYIVEKFTVNLEKMDFANYNKKPEEVKMLSKQPFVISHNKIQKNLIQRYKKEFNNNFDGLGKMLMRYPHIHLLFRHAKIAS